VESLRRDSDIDVARIFPREVRTPSPLPPPPQFVPMSILLSLMFLSDVALFFEPFPPLSAMAARFLLLPPAPMRHKNACCRRDDPGLDASNMFSNFPSQVPRITLALCSVSVF